MEQYSFGGTDEADKKEVRMQNASRITAQLCKADKAPIMQNNNTWFIQKRVSRNSCLKKMLKTTKEDPKESYKDFQ